MTLKNNKRVGKIVAVCRSDKGGVPKHPQKEIEVYLDGVMGDYHSGSIDKHRKSGEPKPNDRAISIVAKEVTDSVGETLQVELAPGSLGENFLVEGLGDLSDLAPGDLIKLGPTVSVVVTAQNAPCGTLTVHHSGIVKHLAGKRGIVGRVLYVGFAKPGDRVEVVKKAVAAQ